MRSIRSFAWSAPMPLFVMLVGSRLRGHIHIPTLSCLFQLMARGST